jgi:2-polyprenyl-3-methyl-5-hydroxy-6-metoxy-1,4-benzoquinol methylase
MPVNDVPISWQYVDALIGDALGDEGNYHARRSLWSPGAFTMRETAADVPLKTLKGPLLDLGCGCGTWLLYLRSLGVEAIGVDRSPKYVSVANALLKTFGFPESAAVGDLREQTGEYAAVTAFGILYDVYHPRDGGLGQMLDYLQSLVAPRGWLAFEYYIHQENELEERGYISPVAILAMGERRGLDIVTVTTRKSHQHEVALYVFRRSS